MTKNKIIAPIAIAIIALLLVGGIVLNKNSKPSQTPIKIGVITDLTGPAAYWGETTRVGAELAKKDLEKEGYKVDLVYEDYQLDPAKAVSSAQKLINTDKVDAIYAEFNPAAYAINPIVKDKSMLFVYAASPVSQLAENQNAYKTYLDFEQGCENLANRFKDQGINKMGFLKLGWEAGELCLSGVKKVYTNENLTIESFNFGDQDVKTQVTKIKNAGAEAIMNVALESDTMTVFKAMQDLKFNVPYGTMTDGIADSITKSYPEQVSRTTVFGFGKVSDEFSKRIEQEAGKKMQTEEAAALAYIHINEMVKSIATGNGDMNTVKAEMNKSKPNNIIGFNGFENRIAKFDEQIRSLAK